jgi:hypothetical protein
MLPIGTALRERAKSRRAHTETESSQTHCWREMDSNFWYRGTKAVDFRSIPGMAGDRRGSLKRHHLIVQPFFFCARD